MVVISPWPARYRRRQLKQAKRGKKKAERRRQREERKRLQAMEGDTLHQQVSPSTAKTLQELAADGKKQLETVVEIAHQILLSLNEALCSPSFWVAPSSSHLALESSSVSSNSLTAVSDPAAGAGRDSGGEGEAGLAALEATSLRYKVATAALRATVASILNTPQVIFLSIVAPCLSPPPAAFWGPSR